MIWYTLLFCLFGTLWPLRTELHGVVVEISPYEMGQHFNTFTYHWNTSTSRTVIIINIITITFKRLKVVIMLDLKCPSEKPLLPKHFTLPLYPKNLDNLPLVLNVQSREVRISGLGSGCIGIGPYVFPVILILFQIYNNMDRLECAAITGCSYGDAKPNQLFKLLWMNM